MARRTRWFIVCSFIVLLFVGVFAAQAQSAVWQVVSLNSVGCANSATNFTTEVSGIASFPTSLRFRTIVDAGGIRYMDEDAGTPGSNGNYGWSLYTSSSGGPITSTFPILPNTQIRVQFLLIDGVGGPTVHGWEVVLSQCNGGTMLYNGPLGGFSQAGGTCPGVTDGRLNNSGLIDCAAPVVLYKVGDSLDIYTVDPSTSSGHLLIQIPTGPLGTAIPANVLIHDLVNPGTGMPVQVYQLASGGVQVNASYEDGKLYSVVWTPTGGLTHLAW